MFRCDERLTQGSFKIAHWPICEIRLKDNHHFPWIVLIPRINDITEIHELSEEIQTSLMKEISRASKLMEQHFKSEKINIGALGNIVPQLHVHIVARFKNDTLWPHSLWQKDMPCDPYDEKTLESLLPALTKLFFEV